MNYTHLGRTGLKVSRLCLGTMNFGDVTDEKTSARILDEALRRVSISLIQQTCMALNNPRYPARLGAVRGNYWSLASAGWPP
jgi:hypothetical protein